MVLTVKDCRQSIKDVVDFFRLAIPKSSGGTNGLSPEMIQSQHCYVSESEYHMDMDKSKRVSIWSKAETDLTDDARGW